MATQSENAREYARWLRRLRRALRREGLPMSRNKGYLMAEFWGDRTPEEVARRLADTKERREATR